MRTSKQSSWLWRKGLDRWAFPMLVALASSVVHGQDTRQTQAGVTSEEKTEDRARYYQKAFEAQAQIGAEQATRRWTTALGPQYYYSYYGAADGFRIGASLHEVDDALRTHLKLPDGQGLVVGTVATNSAAARAGIKKHDVLLTVDGKPLSTGEDLKKALTAVEGKGVTIRLIRGGEAMTVTVQPDAKSAAWSYSLVDHAARGHRIGVEVAEVDDTLRSQLRLPEGKGLVVTKVLPDSPARKAGIEAYDVLLEAGPLGAAKKPLVSVKELRDHVGQSGGKEIAITALRQGKELEIRVTPTASPGEVYWSRMANRTEGNPALQYLYGVRHPAVAAFSPDGKTYVVAGEDGTTVRLWDASTGKLLDPVRADVETELDQVLGQLETLRKTVENLRDRVKTQGAAETPREEKPTEDK